MHRGKKKNNNLTVQLQEILLQVNKKLMTVLVVSLTSNPPAQLPAYSPPAPAGWRQEVEEQMLKTCGSR